MHAFPLLPLISVWGILGIILGVAAVVLVVLYFVGRKLQKKQADAEEQIQNAKQTVSILVMADQKVFEIIPVKKECKVALSGIYIAELKSVRGGKIPDPPKKQKLLQRIFKKDPNKKAATNKTAEKAKAK